MVDNSEHRFQHCRRYTIYCAGSAASFIRAHHAVEALECFGHVALGHELGVVVQVRPHAVELAKASAHGREGVAQHAVVGQTE